MKVYDREGKDIGLPTGAEYPCSMEGCRGRRIVIKWPDGKITRPCSKGMTVREDGNLQII
jgi:hypothetical protein